MSSKILPLEPIRGFNNASGDKTNTCCCYIPLEKKCTAEQSMGYLYSHSEKTKKETFGCKLTKHGRDFGSVHLGCWSKTHQPEWNSFFMVWAAEKSRSKHQPIRCLEELLSASQMAFSGCVLACGTVNKFPVSCFIGLLLFLFYSGFFGRPTE